MYLVTIINSTTRTVINDVSVRIDANRITGTIKQGINCIDSFTFEIYPNNIGYNLIYPFRTSIEVYNTKKNKYEFRGRVIQQTSQMDSDGSIKKSCICESELGFLWDSIQLYGQYADFKSYLEKMINYHNETTKDKEFKLGNITVQKTGEAKHTLKYDTSWNNLKALFEEYGGEIQLRYEEDGKYIDYLTQIGKECKTEIKLAKNIQDIVQEIDATTYYTRLIPLGAKLKTTDEEGNEVDSEERLTIASVNNGCIYIDDDNAIKEFGIIVGVADYSDVTLASNLFKKGEADLLEQRINIQNKITALDLSVLGIDIEDFQVGNTHPLKHELLGINTEVRIVEKTISIESPESTSITLGKKLSTIKEYQLSLKNELATSTTNVSQQLEYITTSSINSISNIELKLTELDKRLKALEPPEEEGAE